MEIVHQSDGRVRVHLDAVRDRHLLIAHTVVRGYRMHRLTDDVEWWLIEHARRSRHQGTMVGYWIEFADEDLAFHFKMRWA